MGRVLHAGVAVLLAALVAACALLAGSPTELSYSNQTSIPVDLVVNGTKIATIAAGRDGKVPLSVLPPLPWNATAQTARGRTLASLIVRPGDVVKDGNGQRGVGIRADLSCGRLEIWSGPPLSGPAPGPGTPGDCDP